MNGSTHGYSSMTGTIQVPRIFYYSDKGVLMRVRFIDEVRAYVFGMTFRDTQTAVQMGLIPSGLHYLSGSKWRGLHEPIVYEVLRLDQADNVVMRSPEQLELRQQLQMARAEIHEVVLP